MDKYSLECCKEHLAMNMEKQRQPVKGKTMRDGKKEAGCVNLEVKSEIRS